MLNIEKVINLDLCIGCGACASIENSNFKVEFNPETGKFLANYELNSNINEILDKVCPFSNSSKNENDISKSLFEKYTSNRNPYFGYYIKNFAGYVVEGNIRENGSSGGLAKWILAEMLRNNLVDYIVQVKTNNNPNDPLIYTYQIDGSIDDVLSGSKSAYYPVSMTEVLKKIKNIDGRYAIIGVPCFIKSIRLLMENDNTYKERIRYCIGIVCGHLKSSKFADMLAWQEGIKPGNLIDIDFRVKIPGEKAHNKGLYMRGFKGDHIVENTDSYNNYFGIDYGHGFLKYKACDFCDDVFAETADIVFGDAWLKKYAEDYRGNNIVVVRNPILLDILENAARLNRVKLAELSENDIVRSQDAGLRHRREGLSYRLYKFKKSDYVPIKRVIPSNKTLSFRYKIIHRLRLKIGEMSDIYFNFAIEKNDYKYFFNKMKPFIKEYELTYFIGYLKPKILMQAIKKRIYRLIRRSN